MILHNIIQEEYNEFLNEATASEIREKYYNFISEEDFNKIIDSDPTTDLEKNQMGKYSKWLLNLFKRKELKLEDLYKVEEYLETFDKYKNKIEVKDINKIKTLPQLYDVVKDYIDSDEATSKKDEIRKIKKDAEKVYEDNEWLVVVPKTEEAACYYGKNTQWCTAATQYSNQFNHYNRYGKIYININKITNEKYQFHFEYREFMDERNSPITTDDLEIDEGDGLYEFYSNQGLDLPVPTLESAIKNYDYDLFYELLNEETATSNNFYLAVEKNNFEFVESIALTMSKDEFEYILDDFIEFIPYIIRESGVEYEEAFIKLIEKCKDVGYNFDDKDFFYKTYLDFIEDNGKTPIKGYIRILKDQEIYKYFKYVYENNEDYFEEFKDDMKIADAWEEIESVNLSNKRVNIKVLDIIMDGDENIQYNIKITYKNSGNTKTGKVKRNKFYSLLNNYDLFED